MLCVTAFQVTRELDRLIRSQQGTALDQSMTDAGANSSLGGYDEEFVNAVEEDLICPICRLPLKEAVQTGVCGHRLCRQCLDGHFIRLALISFYTSRTREYKNSLSLARCCYCTAFSFRANQRCTHLLI